MQKTVNRIRLGVACTVFLLPCSLNIPDKIQGLTEKQCLIANLYFEARGESLAGMKAVAAVTYNRTNKETSLCSVVFKPWQFSWVKQVNYKEFSSVVAGNTQAMQKKDLQAYRTAVIVASMPASSVQKMLPKSTRFYHATYAKPKWASKMQKVAVIGRHIFYKES